MLFKIKELTCTTTPVEKSILARRALYALLAENYGIEDLPDIAVDSNGKPFFPSHPDIHFSLSHCDLAVMAAIDSHEIGCDIEIIQPAPKPELLEVAFCRNEIAKILASSSPGVTLTELWTRKEAAVKRCGSIPDDPRCWSSDDPDTITQICRKSGYVFSIAVLRY